MGTLKKPTKTSHNEENTLKPPTKTSIKEECEICGDMFESEKDLCDHYTKKHENTITLNMRCAYRKCTADEVCDDCLEGLTNEKKKKIII